MDKTITRNVEETNLNLLNPNGILNPYNGRTHNTTLRSSSMTKAVIPVSLYITYVQVTDATGNAAPNVSVALAACTATSVSINHLDYVIDSERRYVARHAIWSLTWVRATSSSTDRGCDLTVASNPTLSIKSMRCGTAAKDAVHNTRQTAGSAANRSPLTDLHLSSADQGDRSCSWRHQVARQSIFQLQAKLTSRTIQPLSIQGIFAEMGNVSVSFDFDDPSSRPASLSDAGIGGVGDADGGV